jgi:outer membrane protein OmpA-like peptidoglycan-associated protein
LALADDGGDAAVPAPGAAAEDALPRGTAPEGWRLRVDLLGGRALTAPQRDLFGWGGFVGAAALRSLSPWLLAGAGLRAGVLRDGRAPADPTRADPGTGGWGAGLALVRLRPLGGGAGWRLTGPWIEVGAGAGLTGTRVRPTAELAAGWGFAVRGWVLAPVIRYAHVFQPSGGLDGRDARLGLVGIEIGLGDAPPPPPPQPPPAAPSLPPAPPPPPPDRDGDGILDVADRCPDDPEDVDGFEDADGCPDPDNDGDGILDAEDRCPTEREVVNGVDDHDGCPDEGLIELVDDRVVLEEHVLFDLNRARVRSRARAVLAAVHALIQQHPEWEAMVVEGHADRRGPARFNDWLSLERAHRVHAALVGFGVPEAFLRVEGKGSTQPRDPGHDEAAHQRNRRVELVVVRRKEVAR